MLYSRFLVEDHVSAIWLILRNGKIGETYNIGGENEWENVTLVNKLCEIVAALQGKNKDYFKSYVTFVKDRPGHDCRYAINCDKIKEELGWRHAVSFEEGLCKTADGIMKLRLDKAHQKWRISKMDQKK